MSKRLAALTLCAFVVSVVPDPVVYAGDPTLVGWWKFDEGAGITARDSSSYGNDGTLIGDPRWVTGQIGSGALSFDGSDGLVEASESPVLDIDSTLTITAWVNLTNLSTYYFVVCKSPSGTAASNYPGNYEFRIQSATGLLEFGHQTAQGQEYVFYPSTTAITSGQWYHVAVTFLKGDRVEFYVNGESAGGADQTANFGILNDEPIRIGGRKDNYSFFNGLIDDVRIYSRVLTPEELPDVLRGKGPNAELADNPSPTDEQTDVPRDTVLAWEPGEFAATHDVYFGTAFDDVNGASRANPMGVLVSQDQTGTTFDPPGVLAFGTMHYWRVDEVNAAPDHTTFKGEVWSFTTEPVAYPLADIIATSNGISDTAVGPQNTVNGSGLNEADQHSTASRDMWLATTPADGPLHIQYAFDRVYKLHQMFVWNYNEQFELILGFGLKDVTVEYSENGTDWMTLGDIELARATARADYTANTTVDFAGVPAKYVRLTVNGGWGMMGQYGLSEVRFMYIPAQAREPQPTDGATGIDPETTLNWRTGREAVSHELYLGTDPADLPLVDTIDAASYAVSLEFGTTYHWQVVEVNEAEAVSTWASNVWNFSTREYALIDGFETYNDDVDAGTTIFDTWIDGWVNGNGSTVGYFDAPFAEKSIVHSGSQSMPLAYDNAISPFYSEAERTFEAGQDWTTNGTDSLSLYCRGVAPAFIEIAEGNIVMNGIGADIWNMADQFRFAYKSLSGDGSIIARVDSIANSNAWAKAGVMIRENLEAGSAHAMVVVTPGNGVSFQRRPEADGASANTDVTGLTAPYWVKLIRTGNTLTAQRSEDGVTWTDIEVTPALAIPMTSNVYIGLAVTSHDAAVATGAEFSNVSTTGNVTGAWQVAEIGAEQPEGNSAEPLYVIVRDSSGKTATVVNPDSAATVRPTWNEWVIPLSELAGVDMSRVEAMTVGVGSPDNPTAGGTGIVYIDDIAYGRAATAQ